MKKGFSLIELIVVLTILGVGIVLIYPSLGRVSRSVELKTTAKKVSAILRYYRSEAVQKGNAFQVVFDTDTREIRVRPIQVEEGREEGEKNGEGKLKEKERYVFPEGVLVKDLKISASQYPSEYPVIEFYPNGGSNGGSFVIERENSKSFRIQVNFLTGVVELKEG